MFQAAIFDLDGLLIDSEPLWRRAEVEIFATVGLVLTDADCEVTTGLRIDEVVAFQHGVRPWHPPRLDEVAARIVDRVIELIETVGVAKPFGAHAVALCEREGLQLALASSSPERLIHAALRRLGLTGRFGLVQSAQHERWGKPHPAVFLTTAERLGVPPVACVVLEDSLNGVIAAKAARMRCLAVPERPDPRFVLADRVLPSLQALDRAALVE
jgi:beta-phosphoglucomutase-like phosphatase (HAD superfamily)